MNFICMSHNCHGRAHSGDRAPREIVSGRKLPQQEFALFGAKVHVEVPDSIRKLCPNMTRFIDGTFLHPQFNSLGSVVLAHVRIGDELVPRVFVAKSIKLSFPSV